MHKAPGTVFLVGAGPGDPELLTLKAKRLIEAADVVVYDRLVSKQILAMIPQNTSRIDVGKRPGHHRVPQESINQILLKLAKAGHQVVRLKGGDPMIFGRGGEEVESLARCGICVRTVPGITAAQGCAASLNLPLTQRTIADQLVYVTGHNRDDNQPDRDWAALVNNNTTLVVYMGVANIAALTEKMIAAGVSEKTPALAVCNGTLATQSQLLSNIADMPGDIEQAGFNGPVIFIVGKAAALPFAQETQDEPALRDNSNVVGL